MTTKAQDKILSRLYREVEINIHDGNQKKTVRALEKKGLVEYRVIPMQFGECPEKLTFFQVKLTDRGLNQTTTKWAARES